MRLLLLLSKLVASGLARGFLGGVLGGGGFKVIMRRSLGSAGRGEALGCGEGGCVLGRSWCGWLVGWWVGGVWSVR